MVNVIFLHLSSRVSWRLNRTKISPFRDS